jgi:hypothetical protein
MESRPKEKNPKSLELQGFLLADKIENRQVLEDLKRNFKSYKEKQGKREKKEIFPKALKNPSKSYPQVFHKLSTRYPQARNCLSCWRIGTCADVYLPTAGFYHCDRYYDRSDIEKGLAHRRHVPIIQAFR